MRLNSHLERDLARAFAVDIDSPVHRSLMATVGNAEAATPPRRFASLSRRGIALIVAVIALGGGAATATAAPSLIGSLFPPAVSKSFTFASGDTCTTDTKIVPDYVTAKKPEDAIAAAQAILIELDVSKLPIEDRYAELAAQADASQEIRQRSHDRDPSYVVPPEPSTLMLETNAVSAAVGDAIFDALAREGFSGGVAIEGSGVECK